MDNNFKGILVYVYFGSIINNQSKTTDLLANSVDPDQMTGYAGLDQSIPILNGRFPEVSMYFVPKRDRSP